MKDMYYIKKHKQDRETIENLKSENRHLKLENSSLASLVRNLNKGIVEIENREKVHFDTIEELRDENNELIKVNEVLEERAVEIEGDNLVLEGKIKDLSATIEGLERTNESLKIQVIELKDDTELSSATIAGLRGAKRRLTEVNESIKRYSDGLGDLLVKREDEIEDLKIENGNLKNTIEDFNTPELQI
ncbi:MAG: hypothetical protein U9R19_08245 [Bacteroidota bacterium]|nr:hypothetical protein [Bacteroidota bacterium]